MKLKPIAANMTTLELNNGTVILVSYETPVACFIPIEGYYKTSTKWSNTTTRHINKWLDGANVQEAPQGFFDNLIK